MKSSRRFSIHILLAGTVWVCTLSSCSSSQSSGNSPGESGGPSSRDSADTKGGAQLEDAPKFKRQKPADSKPSSETKTERHR